MKRNRSGAIVRRLGPIGLSVVAAAITAAGFAAISLAANDDNGKGGGDSREAALQVAIGPPGPLGERLSAEDRQKLEDFRACLEEQGVEPPERPRFDPENPPEPPSRDEMERMRQEMSKAHEACKDKLPEELQDMPGPSIGIGPGCGPGGPPPAREERGEDRGGNQGLGFVVPAPAPSGTS